MFRFAKLFQFGYGFMLPYCLENYILTNLRREGTEGCYHAIRKDCSIDIFGWRENWTEPNNSS